MPAVEPLLLIGRLPVEWAPLDGLLQDVVFEYELADLLFQLLDGLGA